MPGAPSRPALVTGGRPLRYRFTATNSDGKPARWNPCGGPHQVLVNLAGAQAGALTDLRTGLARLDAVTGLKFDIVGETSAVPGERWGQEGVSGAWPPVLIAWRSFSGTADSGDAAHTTPVWVQNAQRRLVFVSAAIVFNTDDNGLYHSGPGGTMSRLGLVEHELGHLAGLDDIPGPGLEQAGSDGAVGHELMDRLVGSVDRYQTGDIRGLTLLGRGGCLTVPAP